MEGIAQSPSIILVGRTLKDHLPTLPKWKDIRAAREVIMAERSAQDIVCGRSCTGAESTWVPPNALEQYRSHCGSPKTLSVQSRTSWQ